MSVKVTEKVLVVFHQVIYPLFCFYFVFITKHIQMFSACVIMLKIRKKILDYISLWTSEINSYLPAKSNKPNNSPQRTAKIPSHHIRLKWGEGQRSEFCLFEEPGKEVWSRKADETQMEEGNALMSGTLLYFCQPHLRKKHKTILKCQW